MKIKFRDGTRKRERETRVRRVNKTHATGSVPPPPPRDSQGMHGAERRERRCCPKYFGLPTLLGFFFFLLGKTGERHDLLYLLDTIILNQTKQLLIQLFVPLLHRCTLVRAMSAHALALSLALCRCRVPFDPRGPQSTTQTNAAGGARQVKGRRVTSFFLWRRKRSCSTSRWNPPFVGSLLHKK